MDFTEESDGGVRVYSRKFYGAERTQRNRPAVTVASPPVKREALERNPEIKTFPTAAEPVSIMALDIPVTEEGITPPYEYTDPKDFLPEANENRFYSESVEVSEKIEAEKETEATVYPEKAFEEASEEAVISEIPKEKSEASDTADSSGDVDNTGDIVRCVRGMTFDDMMLTGLLMLGGSGDYDDEIMLILGLILMIGV